MNIKTDFCKELDAIPPSGIREFFELVQNKASIISLGVGEPDFSTPKRIAQAGIDSILKGSTSYTSNQGHPELISSIQNYLKDSQGLTYQKNELLITNGASEGIDLVFRALCNRGDEVIVPSPSYVCYTPLLQLCGVNIKTIDTTKTNFIPDPQTIKKCITSKTKALVLCSPNNPTGVCIPTQTLKEIAQLAKQFGFWIISDEIYHELQYEKVIKSIANFNIKDQCVIISGFSKAFAMTGWRLGYMAGPNSLLSRCLKIHQYSALCTPTMAQYAAIEALKKPFKEVEEMKAAYNERRKLMLKTFNKLGFKTPNPTGAFYCFPDISSINMDGESFARKLLEEQEVAVVPGTAFGQLGKNYIRCCYAYPLSHIKEALIRIENFVIKIKGVK